MKNLLHGFTLPLRNLIPGRIQCIVIDSFRLLDLQDYRIPCRLQYKHPYILFQILETVS